MTHQRFQSGWLAAYTPRGKETEAQPAQPSVSQNPPTTLSKPSHNRAITSLAESRLFGQSCTRSIGHPKNSTPTDPKVRFGRLSTVGLEARLISKNARSSTLNWASLHEPPTETIRSEQPCKLPQPAMTIPQKAFHPSFGGCEKFQCHVRV